MNTESRRQFPAFEATSLTNKFNQLWLAGIEARLVFETHGGQAWGTLHVCLGEHPGLPQPHFYPQEPHHKHISPAKQRRRERREAARVEAAAAAEKEEVTEEVTENENEKDDQTSNSEKSQVTEEVENDHTVVIDNTVQVSAPAVENGQLFLTEIDDEVCSDEEYYEEIDPGEAFTCFQCNIEHFPANYVESGKVKKYGLCRWHLGVSKCKKCAKNFFGLGYI